VLGFDDPAVGLCHADGRVDDLLPLTVSGLRFAFDRGGCLLG
jgi:hypothetical protein